jgi:hypothetical protein
MLPPLDETATFTGAILPIDSAGCERRWFAMLALNVETLFYLLAILQILTGVYLLWQGLGWLAYVRRRVRTDPGFYAPRTAVLCPCKGMEPGLEQNLGALTEFDHQNYEVFFILASTADPAHSTVQRVAARQSASDHRRKAANLRRKGEQSANRRSAAPAGV